MSTGNSLNNINGDQVIKIFLNTMQASPVLNAPLAAAVCVAEIQFQISSNETPMSDSKSSFPW